jgi:hypothetical protein
MGWGRMIGSISQVFWTLGLGRGEWSVSRSCLFTRREIRSSLPPPPRLPYPFNRRTGRASDSAWTLWRTEKLFIAHNRTRSVEPVSILIFSRLLWRSKLSVLLRRCKSLNDLWRSILLRSTGLVKIMLTLDLVGLVLQTFDGPRLADHTRASSLQLLFFAPRVNLSPMAYVCLQEKNNPLMLT